MRPARALIDLQALRHNYRLARELAGAKALAVVKADAYGHGAVRCALALEADADGFAVACIEEALELRAAGIKAPVLLLEGFFEASELALIAEHDLWCVVHSLWQLEAIEQHPVHKPLNIWLKLDSGMHRVGLHPKDYHEAYQRLLASGREHAERLGTTGHHAVRRLALRGRAGPGGAPAAGDDPAIAHHQCA